MLEQAGNEANQPGDEDHPLLSRSALVFAFFGALSLTWAWPLPTRLASRIAFDPGDPFLNTWILWWNAQALPFSTGWWSPPIFYPMPGALALSEHLAGIALLTTPLLLVGGSPALAYNLALLASTTLSGFLTYLLVRRLTGSTLAALAAGVAYAVAPVRAGQLSHLQVLTSQWLPLMLLGLHGFAESGKNRWLVLFGLAWLVQGLSNGYYLLFAPALVVTWMCWFVLAARRWRQAALIAAAWVLASLPLVPVLLKYRQVHTTLGLSRSPGEILQFSGEWASFLKPAPMLAFWPASPRPAVEDFLFPGLTILIVIALGLWRSAAPSLWPAAAPAIAFSRGTFLFYVFAALLMAALTLGPARPGEAWIGWLRPYQWLVALPGFDGVRVPARFGMLMALCLSVAGGVALAALLPVARIRRAGLAAAVIAGLYLDGAIQPLTGSPPPGRVELPAVAPAAVLELPADDVAVNVGAMLRAMSHRLPLINGYSGHVPAHYDILGQSLRRDDPSGVIELARGRALLISIADRDDPAGDFRRVIESIPGIEPGGSAGTRRTYLLPAQPRHRRAAGGTRYRFTATTLPRSHALLDLGARRSVRALEIPLRRRYPDLGRRFKVEISDDGERWSAVWDDWTAGAAVAGALEDQVVVPLRFTLADPAGRYLRIHPAPDWMVQELLVLGP